LLVGVFWPSWLLANYQEVESFDGKKKLPSSWQVTSAFGPSKLPPGESLPPHLFANQFLGVMSTFRWVLYFVEVCKIIEIAKVYFPVHIRHFSTIPTANARKIRPAVD
jgi:hypothetical protein